MNMYRNIWTHELMINQAIDKIFKILNADPDNYSSLFFKINEACILQFMKWKEK